ncbi:unnamed protein product, partial [Ectocarpus sp. 13 AM-2016]
MKFLLTVLLALKRSIVVSRPHMLDSSLSRQFLSGHWVLKIWSVHYRSNSPSQGCASEVGLAGNVDYMQFTCSYREFGMGVRPCCHGVGFLLPAIVFDNLIR